MSDTELFSERLKAEQEDFRREALESDSALHPDSDGKTPDERAADALTAVEAAGARHAGWSASEYVSIIYDLNAAEYDSDVELIEAMNAADDTGKMRPEESDSFATSEASDDRFGWTAESSNAGTPKQVEAAADAVLTPEEKAKVEAMNATAAEFIKQEYGVNPGRFNSEKYLIEAVSAARREQ